MPVDTAIYNAFLQPPKSALDYENQFLTQQQHRQSLQQNALTLQQAMDVQQQRNNLRSAVQGGSVDLTTPQGQSSAVAQFPDVAPPLIKTVQEGITSGAAANKDNAQASDAKANAARTSQDIQFKAHTQQLQQLATVNNPQDALTWLTNGLSNGTLTSDQFQQGVTNLQKAASDPTGQAFSQWKQANMLGGMTLQDQMAQTTAKPTEVRLGNVVKTIDMNPHSPTYGKEVVPAQAVGVSPDAQLQAGTSTANNRANIQKDLLVAGIGPDGSPTADVAATVKAIGEGRMAPPTLQALRNPRMASIMNQVNQQYPNFDATVYGERQKAMKDFGTGPQGQQVQAANTALNHLDTLEQLAKAQANNNIPLFNQLANQFAKETGSPVPTNLQGAITLVGPEISKAVVGAGGGQGDREKVDSALSAIVKGSPDQQAGQIATMKDIFGGRLSEVGRTYQRSTHLDNFTDMLSPAAQAIYAAKHGPGSNAGATSLPSADAIKAELQRRGVQ